jgi:uncharacterized protein (TIGR02147 family)
MSILLVNKAVNMSIFSKLDYRVILKEIVEGKKKIDSSINFQSLATASRIQKAYLSQVIKGHRDLSQDQLHLACGYLELKEHESHYFSLLLEYARSGLSERKKKLLQEIKKLQKQHSKTSAHIEVNVHERNIVNRDDYHLDPFNQIVHLCISIPKLRDNPKAIAKALFVPLVTVTNSLKKLEKMDIIKVENGKIVDEARDLHIPKDSPLFLAWKNSLNLLSQNRIRLLGDSKSYNFSVVFTADEEVQKEIHHQFMLFLKKVKKMVEKCEDKEVFQMNFDLFSWSEES